MAVPPDQTICLVRDDDASLVFGMDDVQDITGWAVSFVVRLRDANGDLGATAIINKSVGSGVALTDTTNGVITVTLADTDTSSVMLTEDLDTGASYRWSLRRTDAGSETTLARGEFILLQEVE